MATGRLAARWGVEGLVLRSTVACAGGLALIGAAPAWPVVLAGGVLAGTGAGGMDTGFNAAVALDGDPRRMGLLHAGYGVGAAIGPVVVGGSLAVGAGWRPPYGLFAVAALLLALPLRGRSLGDAPAQHPMGTPRGVVVPCLAFCAYVALEVAIGQWAYSYLTAERRVGSFAASCWVGAYWVGLTAGRVWLGVAGHRHGPLRLLAGAVLVAGAGVAVLAVGAPLSSAGLVPAGLGLSVVFPILMLLTPERVGAERAAAAVGWQAAAAGVGSAAGPVLAGVVFERHGLGLYPAYCAVVTLLLAACLAALARRPGAEPISKD